MENYLDIEFQWYKNGIKTIKPSGLITLRQLINSIISPKPEMIEAFKLIQEASLAGNNRRTEDNYNYADEGLEKYSGYFKDCWKINMSCYKALKFLWFEINEEL